MSTLTDEPAAPVAALPPRRGRPLRWVALAVGLVVVGLLGVLATRQTATNVTADTVLAGRTAPEISGALIDGGSGRLSDHRGKWVVVNFVASWCVPCRNEQPELIRFDQRAEAAGDIVLLGVVFSDEPENVRSFMERSGADWPVFADESGRAALDFGVRAPPETFLIAPDGTVLTRIPGEVTADGLDALLDRIKELGG